MGMSAHVPTFGICALTRLGSQALVRMNLHLTRLPMDFTDRIPHVTKVSEQDHRWHSVIDSAHQEESIGTPLVYLEGFLLLNNKVLSVRGGVGRPLKPQGGSRGISGHGVWYFVSYPPPWQGHRRVPRGWLQVAAACPV